jgi:hypothetical protein
MQLVWAERSYPITGGILASLVFHVLLALLIVLGVPSFLQVEELPERAGIEATIVSDITAAPKVDKVGKLQDKPKPPRRRRRSRRSLSRRSPHRRRRRPRLRRRRRKWRSRRSCIPDETKKAEEEKKKEEKKPEEKKVEKKPEEKKKEKPKEEVDFNKMLTDLTNNQPAPETQEKPKQKAKPAPASRRSVRRRRWCTTARR